MSDGGSIAGILLPLSLAIWVVGRSDSGALGRRLNAVTGHALIAVMWLLGMMVVFGVVTVVTGSDTLGMVAAAAVATVGALFLLWRHALAVLLLRRGLPQPVERAVLWLLTASPTADQRALHQSRVLALLGREASVRLAPHTTVPTMRTASGVAAHGLRLWSLGHTALATDVLEDATRGPHGRSIEHGRPLAERAVCGVLVAEQRWDEGDLFGLECEAQQFGRTRQARVLMAAVNERAQTHETGALMPRSSWLKRTPAGAALFGALEQVVDPPQSEPAPATGDSLLERVLAAHLEAIGTPARRVQQRVARAIHAARGWEAVARDTDTVTEWAVRAADLGQPGASPVAQAAREALDELAALLEGMPEWVWRNGPPPEVLRHRIAERLWERFEQAAERCKRLNHTSDPVELYEAWVALRGPWVRLRHLVDLPDRYGLLRMAWSAIGITATECSVNKRARAMAMRAYPVFVEESAATRDHSVHQLAAQNLRYEARVWADLFD